MHNKSSAVRHRVYVQQSNTHMFFVTEGDWVSSGWTWRSTSRARTPVPCARHPAIPNPFNVSSSTVSYLLWKSEQACTAYLDCCERHVVRVTYRESANKPTNEPSTRTETEQGSFFFCSNKMWLSQWREEKAGRIERSGRIEIEKPTRLTGHLDATPSSHRRRRSWATWPKPAFQGVALSSHDHRCSHIYIHIYIYICHGFIRKHVYITSFFFIGKARGWHMYVPVCNRAVTSGRQVPVVLEDTLEVVRVRQVLIVASHPFILGSLLTGSFRRNNQYCCIFR
jgi:hypothetical protein